MSIKVPSVKDVAKLAGVSVATVSNVISEQKYVSPELTVRVNNAIKELNYRPSKIARSLKGMKTYQIGLMIPDITNPYFAELARGAESVALKKGYQVLLCNTDGDSAREEKARIAFEENRVDGIINVAPRMKTEKLLAVDHVPTVIVDRPLSVEQSKFGVVFADNSEGACQLAKHLFEKGHRRFACLTAPYDDIPSVKHRINGFKKYLIENGINDEDILFLNGKLRYKSGYELMNELLEIKNRPTAVFACSDIMAWGALEAAKKAHLNIPKDIAIAGFDNIYYSEILDPMLTTVNQPKSETGEIAMQMLLDRLNKSNNRKIIRTHSVILDTELIIREST